MVQRSVGSCTISCTRPLACHRQQEVSLRISSSGMSLGSTWAATCRLFRSTYSMPTGWRGGDLLFLDQPGLDGQLADPLAPTPGLVGRPRPASGSPRSSRRGSHRFSCVTWPAVWGRSRSRRGARVDGASTRRSPVSKPGRGMVAANSPAVGVDRPPRPRAVRSLPRARSSRQCTGPSPQTAHHRPPPVPVRPAAHHRRSDPEPLDSVRYIGNRLVRSVGAGDRRRGTRPRWDGGLAWLGCLSAARPTHSDSGGWKKPDTIRGPACSGSEPPPNFRRCSASTRRGATCSSWPRRSPTSPKRADPCLWEPNPTAEPSSDSPPAKSGAEGA